MPLYPLELRQRIVDAYDRGEGTIRDLAALFDVTTATVQNYLNRRKLTGTVHPKSRSLYGPKPLIDDAGLEVIRTLVSAANDRTVAEYIDLYAQRTHLRVSHSVMVRALRRAGFTRKKKRYVPASRTVQAS